jgi:hypothetical protein
MATKAHEGPVRLLVQILVSKYYYSKTYGQANGREIFQDKSCYIYHSYFSTFQSTPPL